jgi:hypothetical protein
LRSWEVKAAPSIPATETHKGAFVKDWHDMPKDEKDAFLLRCKYLYGGHLAAEIEHTMMEKITRRVTKSMITEGKFIDEADLAKEFLGKPEQLESMKKNAAKEFSKERNCTLYENLTLKSVSSCVDEYVKEQTRKYEAVQQVKKDKAPKRLRCANEPAALGDLNTKPITPAQRKRLHGMMAKVKASIEKLTQLGQLASRKEIKDLVPAYASRKAAMAIATAEETVAGCELLIQNDTGDVKAVLDAMAEAKEATEASFQKLDVQVDEAVVELGVDREAYAVPFVPLTPLPVPPTN